MTISAQSTVNLGLPAVPESTDPKLFQELVRVYNAIRILAQGLDEYTGNGTIITRVESTETNAESDLAQIITKFRQFKSELGNFVDTSADLYELKKQYRRYTVPTLTVTAGFGCNSKTPQTAVALPANATDLPTAITLVNAIKAALIANGIGA